MLDFASRLLVSPTRSHQAPSLNADPAGSPSGFISAQADGLGTCSPGWEGGVSQRPWVSYQAELSGGGDPTGQPRDNPTHRPNSPTGR